METVTEGLLTFRFPLPCTRLYTGKYRGYTDSVLNVRPRPSGWQIAVILLSTS